MVKSYKPQQGDIVVADFNPQKGHEQQGRRPALVVSNNIFNEKTGFVLTDMYGQSTLRHEKLFLLKRCRMVF